MQLNSRRLISVILQNQGYPKINDTVPIYTLPQFPTPLPSTSLPESAMAPTSSLPVLPEEMLVEVAACVAASSSSPMANLRRLRGACTLVRDRVCGALLARHSLNLFPALWQSEDAETRERLIANTYAAGNLEAIFI